MSKKPMTATQKQTLEKRINEIFKKFEQDLKAVKEKYLQGMKNIERQALKNKEKASRREENPEKLLKQLDK